MEMEKMKEAVKELKLTDGARARVVRNVRERIRNETEENKMEKSRHTFRKTALIAAAAALCLCVTAALAAGAGAFRNVTRWWDGAVTGTVYEQADGEIDVTASYGGGAVSVTAVFKDPEALPYRELEKLSVGSGRLCDGNGRVAAQWKDAGAAQIDGGKAVMTLPMEDLTGQGYTLYIDSFTGESKADAPLEITGSWKCPLSD